MSVADSDGLGPSASQVSVHSIISRSTASQAGSSQAGPQQYESPSTPRTPSGVDNDIFSPTYIYGDYMNESFNRFSSTGPTMTSAPLSNVDVDMMGVRMGASLTLVGSAPVVVTERFPGTRPPLHATAQGLRDKWRVSTSLSLL